MPTISFKTLGCRLNQAETATMSASFEARGYKIVDFRETSDVAIIHTCTITLNADKECFRLARRLKRRDPKTLVILVGCAVEILDEEAQRNSAADVLIRQSDKQNIAHIVDEHLGRHPPDHKGHCAATLPRFDTTRALVKVQDGCRFYCSYCIVPFTRGNPKSRNFDEIIREATSLSEAGYHEIGLTGANIGCYQYDNHSLIDILEELRQLPAIGRIRISSIEPTTIERDVINMMAKRESLAAYLHLPLQSGDNGVLMNMRRRYTREEFRDVVQYAVDTSPSLGLGTDIITGFPGETEAAFANSYNLIDELPFNNLHVFPYSERPGTRAADLPDPVPMDVRRMRANKLIALGEQKRREFAKSFVGKPVEVLIERVNENGTGRGWSAEYIDIHIENISQQQIGKLIRVTPHAATDSRLSARVD